MNSIAIESTPKNVPAVCWKKTFDNCECAKDKAHKRK